MNKPIVIKEGIIEDLKDGQLIELALPDGQVLHLIHEDYVGANTDVSDIQAKAT